MADDSAGSRRQAHVTAPGSDPSAPVMRRGGETLASHDLHLTSELSENSRV